jgi:ion channel POLLUX/CASTOR
MGKLLLQASLTSGLERVYEEILSFAGNEIYFFKSHWTETKFYNMIYHFDDGIPLGIGRENGNLELRPERDAELGPNDELILLARDDSTIHFHESPAFSHNPLILPNKKLEKQKNRILMLGWHEVGAIYIRDSEGYLSKGSTFDIVVNQHAAQAKQGIANLRSKLDHTKINIIEGYALSFETLKSLEPFSYDMVMILSQDEKETSHDKIDSDTLLILLVLRKISQNPNIDRSKTKIITQVLNSENQDLLIQTDVDDFITSNKLTTMVLAQLSEEPKLQKLYDDIFQQQGSEIYVKSAKLYFNHFPAYVNLVDLVKLAEQRNEICLGIRKGDELHNSNNNFGVKLNIPKQEQIEITEYDFLVVLAEDEL